MVVCVYSCQNATLLEITCHGSNKFSLVSSFLSILNLLAQPSVHSANFIFRIR